MNKKILPPSEMLSPLPAVMVSCGTMDESNIITIAWTGILNSKPPMAYISVRPERYSHDIIKESGEFVLNVTTKELAKATDFCGCTTGAKIDKFKKCGLTKAAGEHVSCPLIAESPINIECKVREVIPLGSHDMFMADIVAVHVNEDLYQKDGRIAIEKADLLSYAHSCYLPTGTHPIGKFGFSVMKPKTKKKLDGKRRAAQRSSKKKA